jgi:hypothetical protein
MVWPISHFKYASVAREEPFIFNARSGAARKCRKKAAESTQKGERSGRVLGNCNYVIDHLNP